MPAVKPTQEKKWGHRKKRRMEEILALGSNDIVHSQDLSEERIRALGSNDIVHSQDLIEERIRALGSNDIVCSQDLSDTKNNADMIELRRIVNTDYVPEYLKITTTGLLEGDFQKQKDDVSELYKKIVARMKKDYRFVRPVYSLANDGEKKKTIQYYLPLNDEEVRDKFAKIVRKLSKQHRSVAAAEQNDQNNIGNENLIYTNELQYVARIDPRNGGQLIGIDNTYTQLLRSYGVPLTPDEQKYQDNVPMDVEDISANSKRQWTGRNDNHAQDLNSNHYNPILFSEPGNTNDTINDYDPLHFLEPGNTNDTINDYNPISFSEPGNDNDALNDYDTIVHYELIPVLELGNTNNTNDPMVVKGISVTNEGPLLGWNDNHDEDLNSNYYEPIPLSQLGNTPTNDGQLIGENDTIDLDLLSNLLETNPYSTWEP